MVDDRDSEGRLTKRPEGAAEIFTSETGRAAARKRWDRERENTQNALIEKVEKELGKEVSLAEAVNYAINIPLIEKALEKNVPALKFLTQKLDLLPMGGSEQNAQMPQTVQQFNVYNFGTVKQTRDFADQLDTAGETVLAALVRSQIDSSQDEQVIEVPID